MGLQQSERRRWAARFAPPLQDLVVYRNRRIANRRLRIGYLSADFRHHSAAMVFGAMLLAYDRVNFEVYAYSNSVKEDPSTEEFKQNVTVWRQVVGLTDAALAQQIVEDEIDILVDLSGHSAGNRLQVFAKKPAPIQVTAWGYIGGTGMSAMDVFFADPVLVPEAERSLYAEAVHYLPNVVSFYTSKTFPDVGELPADESNVVTFGSFNRMCKLSEAALELWGEVLFEVPGSRLVLKTGELDDRSQRERIYTKFATVGIEPSRIILLGKTSWEDHMRAFHQVDIALDPYPHGGGVTTLEGFMMGVPVVTLRWPTVVGRLSSSFLTTLGMTEWIAESPREYVEIAVSKAKDLSALSDLRKVLRRRLQQSIIGDHQAYVNAVQDSYRHLWLKWLERPA